MAYTPPMQYVLCLFRVIMAKGPFTNQLTPFLAILTPPADTPMTHAGDPPLLTDDVFRVSFPRADFTSICTI